MAMKRKQVNRCMPVELSHYVQTWWRRRRKEEKVKKREAAKKSGGDQVRERKTKVVSKPSYSSALAMID